LEVSAAAVARRYQDLLDGYVLDRADAAEAEKLGIPVTLAHTLMTTLADREELARRVLAGADALAKASASMRANATPPIRSTNPTMPSSVSPACSARRGGRNWRWPCSKTCSRCSPVCASSPAFSW